MATPKLTRAELVERIRSKLSDKSYYSGPGYTLIVGAGFSYGVVPLTWELMAELIGDFYILDSGEGVVERSVSQKRRYSARFWKEHNQAAVRYRQPVVPLNPRGLPEDPVQAYQLLFTYNGANALWSPTEAELKRKPTLLEKLQLARDGILLAKGEPLPRPETLDVGGEKFVKEFLHHILDPGGSESTCQGGKVDYCTAGRNRINASHFYLASLLELQQTGKLWNLRPFCRTIFTTNFDTLLQNALQLVHVLYSLTDRPERGLDPADFPEEEPVIHLVYTHGSILRHNPASTEGELAELSRKNAAVLKKYLESRDVIVAGYGGWPDTLMSALDQCEAEKHELYWCNVTAIDKLPQPVVKLLEKGGRRAYVDLGADGADGFMIELFHALAPKEGSPELLRDPEGAFSRRQWILDRVRWPTTSA